MKVKIKTFDVNMELKQNGVELQVNDTDGSLLGDCYVAMRGLTWCKGKTKRENGVGITWKQLQELARSEESLKAALKAAKAAP